MSGQLLSILFEGDGGHGCSACLSHDFEHPIARNVHLALCSGDGAASQKHSHDQGRRSFSPNPKCHLISPVRKNMAHKGACVQSCDNLLHPSVSGGNGMSLEAILPDGTLHTISLEISDEGTCRLSVVSGFCA
jgi:hypothetical protein